MLFANQDMNERGSHINAQRDSVFFNGSMRGSQHKELENMNEQSLDSIGKVREGMLNSKEIN